MLIIWFFFFFLTSRTLKYKKKRCCICTAEILLGNMNKYNDHFYCMWHVLYGYYFELYIFFSGRQRLHLFIYWFSTSFPLHLISLSFVSCKGKIKCILNMCSFSIVSTWPRSLILGSTDGYMNRFYSWWSYWSVKGCFTILYMNQENPLNYSGKTKLSHGTRANHRMMPKSRVRALPSWL